MLYNSHKTRTLDTETSLKKDLNDFNKNTTFALYFSFVKILNLQNLKIAADPLNIDVKFVAIHKNLTFTGS